MGWCAEPGRHADLVGVQLVGSARQTRYPGSQAPLVRPQGKVKPTRSKLHL